MAKISFVTENPNLDNVLQRRLQLQFNPLEIGDRPLVLVDANSIFTLSGKRIDREGIDKAWEHANDSNNVVIILSLEPEWLLRTVSQDFVGLMTKANVGFCDIIDLSKVLPVYQEIVAGKKSEDPTELYVYEFHKKQRQIAILRHNIRQVNYLDARQNWFNEARAIGLKGSDDEIVAYVRDWKPETAGEFHGKQLSGIFVDAYQTLFDDDWEIDKNVLEIVSRLAKEMGKKVFVISDSPEDELRKLLQGTGISWPLLSKYDLRGANLEIVIDNLSAAEFKKTYGIFPNKFIKITELLD